MSRSDDSLEGVTDTLMFAMKAKKQMINRNLRSAKKECPKCGAWVRFRLAGKRNHIHMACETKGCLWLME